MAEYISKNEALQVISDYKSKCNDNLGATLALEGCWRNILRLPVTDVQPIRLCDTCRHYNRTCCWCSQYNDITYSSNCSLYQAKED